jgi:membrane fusion protein (multidrug efflux system)
MIIKTISLKIIQFPKWLFHKATQSPRSMMISIVVFFGLIIGYNLFKQLMIALFFAHFQFPPFTVATTTVVEKPWSMHIQSVGTIAAVNGVDVNTEVAGNVTQIFIQSGEYIEKNNPLINLDDSVDKATLKYNQSELTLKKINFQRQTDLYKKGATSGSSLDEAKASLQQAEANVEKTEALIEQKHIKAPFSGKVGIRNVNIGQYITPGQTAIVTLQSLDPLYISFNIPEQYLSKLTIHQPIRLSTDVYPRYYFTGKISAINSKIDPNTHNIWVQGIFSNCPQSLSTQNREVAGVHIQNIPNTNEQYVTCSTKENEANHINSFTFLPGMFMNVEVEDPVKSNKMIIPSTAISYSLYGDSVYRLLTTKDREPTGKQRKIYKVERVFVKTGAQEHNDTVIEKGLKKGDVIVAAGEIKLQNGARVVINNDIKLKTYHNPNELGQ